MTEGTTMTSNNHTTPIDLHLHFGELSPQTYILALILNGKYQLLQNLARRFATLTFNRLSFSYVIKIKN